MALSNSRPCLFLTKDSCFLDPVQERRSWELQVLRCGRDGQHGAGELSKTSERVIFKFATNMYYELAGDFLDRNDGDRSYWQFSRFSPLLRLPPLLGHKDKGHKDRGHGGTNDTWALSKITHLRPLSDLKDFETTLWDKEPKILWTESNSSFNYLQWQSTQNYIHTRFRINKGVVVNFSRLPSKLSMSCQRCSK